MEYEISNRLSGVHGSMIRELFKLGASKDIISLVVAIRQQRHFHAGR